MGLAGRPPAPDEPLHFACPRRPGAGGRTGPVPLSVPSAAARVPWPGADGQQWDLMGLSGSQWILKGSRAHLPDDSGRPRRERMASIFLKLQLLIHKTYSNQHVVLLNTRLGEPRVR